MLIRAVEPLDGIELMRRRRSARAARRDNGPRVCSDALRGALKLEDLARGPGRLCEAFAIDHTLDGWDLTRGEELWIGKMRAGTSQAAQIERATRIGVTSARDLLLRFFVADSDFVST